MTLASAILCLTLASVDVRSAPGPLTASIAFPGAPPITVSQQDGVDRGDFTGPGFVQRCRDVDVPGTPLTLSFRTDRDSDRAEVVVTLGRCWGAANAAATNLGPYTVVISRDRATLATVSVPRHTWFARWRWQSKPRAPIRSATDVLALACLPPFDADLVALCRPNRAPGYQWQRVAYTAPMSSAGLWTLMGTAGDRSDIGPITEHQAEWLATGSQPAYIRMMAQAEASGSIPWHFRDETTGRFVNVRDHPQVVLGGSQPGPAAEWVRGTASEWSIDVAHHPSLAFIPFLATGDPYFLEELQACTAWCVGWDRRNRGPAGKAVFSTAQVRAYAWSLRTVAQAASATPETAPAWLLPRAYWAGVLDDNRAWVEQHWVGNPAPWARVFRASRPDMIDPWMEDYLLFSIGWTVRLGFTDWKPALQWKLGHQLARCGQSCSGWPVEFCCPYQIDPRGFASWADLMAAWPKAEVPQRFSPGLPNGAAGIVRGYLVQKWWGYSFYLIGGLASANTPESSAAYANVKALTLASARGWNLPSAPYRWAFGTTATSVPIPPAGKK